MSDQPEANSNNNEVVFSDATNRQIISESPTKSSQPQSQGILKRGGRKSIGRRVSFAATAHVRVFNEEQGKQDANSSIESSIEAAEAQENDREEAEMEAFRKQFEAENQSQETQPSETDVLKETFSEFDIKSSPMAKTAHSSEFNQSFEVDLKADEQPSFSSYISPEKDLMDLTGPVGNILDDLSSPLSSTSRRSSQIMDFTKCVGSILAQINSTNNKDNNSEEMEMTMPVGSLVVEGDEKRVKLDSSVASSASAGDVSFIENVEMSLVMSPMPSQQQQEPTLSQVASQEARQIASEQEAVAQQAAVMHAEISEAVDQESLQIAQRALNKSMSEAFSLMNQSTNISVTSSEPKQADLKDFLNETGVRFLDNLSNMGRRETAGRPRESTIITPARRLFIQSVLIPETMAVERACSESVSTINAQRAFLADEEAKFNHHPPLAYRQFAALPSGDSQERSLLLGKLKTLKSVARLFARQSWYEWRRGFESGFLEELNRVLSELKSEYARLNSARSALQEATGDTLETSISSLESTLAQLQLRYDSLSRCDWQTAQALHDQVQAERAELARLDAELAEICAAEAELRGRVEGVLEERRIKVEAVQQLRHSVAQFDDCTELALTELKSTMALQEALNGWKLRNVRSDLLAVEYCRNGSSVGVSIYFNQLSGLVTSVLIESENEANSAVMRAAQSLLIPEFAQVPRTLSSVMVQLDRLLQLNRELEVIKVACEVSVGSVQTSQLSSSSSQESFIKTPKEQPQLPLQLTFFNFQSKIKFSVQLAVQMGPQSLSYALKGFECQYGQVSGEAVREVVEENGEHLRKIVNLLTAMAK